MALYNHNVIRRKMNKVIVLWMLLVLVVPLATIFAVENNEMSYFQANMILSNSTNLSNEQIYLLTDLSSDLSPIERTMLFESNKQSPTLPFVVNLLVGYGIGSFVQGDTTGGIIALLGDLVSSGVLYSGYEKASTAIANESPDGKEGTGLMLVGAVGLLAFRIFELTRPFSFASDYNKKLSKALMSVSMVPVITQNKDLQMRLVAKINF